MQSNLRPEVRTAILNDAKPPLRASFRWGFLGVETSDHGRKFLFGVSKQRWNWFIYLGFVQIKIGRT